MNHRPDRRFCSVALYLWLAALTASPAAFAEDARPTLFEASYSIYSRGARIARMDRKLHRDAEGNFLFRSDTRATGLFALFRKDQITETSTWLLDNGQVRPLRYSYEHSGGKKDRDVAVEFDWDGGRVINSVNGSSWHLPASGGILDKLLYQLAIMYDLQADRTELDYTVADGGKLKLYHFERIGEERIETPLGQFDAVKLRRYKSNSRRESILWCARTLGFLPVKVENVEKDGGITTAVIDRLGGIAPDAGPVQAGSP